FAIDANTGVVSVLDNTKLNYETSTSHAITVLASDGAGGTASQAFTIAVTNANPSTPIDSDNSANTAAVAASNGTPVGITAFASDPNGPAVTFSLIDDAGGRFAINPVSGQVTVANGLLLAPLSSHSINV